MKRGIFAGLTCASTLSCLLLCTIFLFPEAASALAPPTPEMIEEYKQDGSLDWRIQKAKELGNDVVDPVLMQRANYRIQKALGLPVDEMAPPSGRRGLPTTGASAVLVLLISFNEYPPANPATEIYSELFGDGENTEYPYDSLKDYYTRSSYNKLTIVGNVLGWTNCGNRSDVDMTPEGREALIMSAMDEYDRDHDFSIYDNNGDGEIDYFIVIWTGPHNGWSNFWWAYKTTWQGNDTYDGVSLGTYSWNYEYQYQEPATPGDFKPKTIIHETGHALGLPDYYDYDDTVGPDGGVGDLDMMDANKGDHNAFSKFILEWLSPDYYMQTTYTYNSITLRAAESYPDAAIIMPGITFGDPFTEYFLFENRNQEINDVVHPGKGLLIWHVDAELNFLEDDFANNNSDTDHKLLRLMEADGLEEIETGNGWADADDYYTNGDTFTPSTTPNSNRYSGSSTGINIANISAPGSTMTFDLRMGTETDPPVQSDWNPVEGATVAANFNLCFTTDNNAACRWALYDYSYDSMSNNCNNSGTSNPCCPVTFTSGGEQTVWMACSDSFGVRDTAGSNTEISYLVDATRPVQSDWDPPAGTTITETYVTTTLKTSERAYCRWSLTDKDYDSMDDDCLGGGSTTHICEATDLPDGVMIMHIACRDLAGNKDTIATNKHLNYTIDGSPPIVSGESPAGGSTLTTYDVELTFSTNENASCRWSLTDKAYDSLENDCTGDETTSITCQLALPSDRTSGFNTSVYIGCIDDAGNKSTAGNNNVVSYYVDYSPPNQGLWSPAKGAEVNSTSVTISFTAGEPAYCRWSLSDLAYDDMAGDCDGDGTTAQECAVTGMVEGNETVYVGCVDSLGNSDTIDSNEHISYVINALPPTQSNWNPADGTTLYATEQPIILKTNENATCRWALLDQAYDDMSETCSGGGTQDHTCDTTGLAGEATVYIACADTAGNGDTTESNTELSYTVDLGTPIQSGWDPPSVTTFTVNYTTLTFSTNEEAACRWALQDLGFNEMQSGALCTGAGSTSQSCDVASMPEGNVTVYLACRDAVSNADTAATNVELTYTVDMSPPIQSEWAPSSGATLAETSATLTLTTNETASCRWSLSDLAYDGMSEDCTTSGNTSHSCPVSGLTAGDNDVFISCCDTLSNCDSEISNTVLTFTVRVLSVQSYMVLEKGWNLVGVSGQSVSIDLSTSPGENLDTVFSYRGELSEVDTSGSSLSLDPGIGYWVYSLDNASEVNSGGTDYTGATFDITLQDGWNAFSIPYNEQVPWNDTAASLSCASLPAVYYYDQVFGYFKVEPGASAKLNPWIGYWIKVDGACTLTITKP